MALDAKFGFVASASHPAATWAAASRLMSATVTLAAPSLASANEHALPIPEAVGFHASASWSRCSGWSLRTSTNNKRVPVNVHLGDVLFGRWPPKDQVIRTWLRMYAGEMSQGLKHRSLTLRHVDHREMASRRVSTGIFMLFHGDAFPALPSGPLGVRGHATDPRPETTLSILSRNKH